MAHTVREREIFAKNLRDLIDKSYLTQTQVAQKMGISNGTMSDYLTGKAFPRPHRLTLLCEILNVSQYDLTTEFYKDDEFVPNREILALAKEIHEDPESRKLFLQIKKLDRVEKTAFSTLIAKLSEKKETTEY